MKASLLHAVAIAVMIATADATAPPPPGQIDSEVIQVAVETLVRSKRLFVIESERSFVVLDTTSIPPFFPEERGWWLKARTVIDQEGRRRRLSAGVLQDLHRRGTPDLTVSLNHSLPSVVPRSESPSADERRQVGSISLSSPGYSTNGTEALLYARVVNAIKAGTGLFVHITKRSNGWSVDWIAPIVSFD